MCQPQAEFMLKYDQKLIVLKQGLGWLAASGDEAVLATGSAELRDFFGAFSLFRETEQARLGERGVENEREQGFEDHAGVSLIPSKQ